MKNLTNESTNAVEVMAEVQEEQIQGGLQSALNQADYGVCAASGQKTADSESPSPWTITF